MCVCVCVFVYWCTYSLVGVVSSEDQNEASVDQFLLHQHFCSDQSEVYIFLEFSRLFKNNIHVLKYANRTVNILAYYYI